MIEFMPSEKPFEDLAENQLSTSSRSSRTVLAAAFISGTLECMIQEIARSSSAASSLVAHEQAARTASTIAQARAVSRCSEASDALVSACRPVRFSGRFSHTYLVPLSRRLFSSQLFASAFLVLSRASPAAA